LKVVYHLKEIKSMPDCYKKYIIPELQKISKPKDEYSSYSSNTQRHLTLILPSDNSEAINTKGK